MDSNDDGGEYGGAMTQSVVVVVVSIFLLYMSIIESFIFNDHF